MAISQPYDLYPTISLPSRPVLTLTPVLLLSAFADLNSSSPLSLSASHYLPLFSLPASRIPNKAHLSSLFSLSSPYPLPSLQTLPHLPPASRNPALAGLLLSSVVSASGARMSDDELKEEELDLTSNDVFIKYK